MNGCWPWAVEVQPSDARHNNLLNTIIIYDNYCEEEGPSYDDFESRLENKNW